MTDLAQIPIITPIDNRIKLLPHHAAYYAKLGFRKFVYALWNGDENPIASRIEPLWRSVVHGGCQFFLRQSISCNYDQYNGPAETPGLNAIREEFVPRGTWYCVADLDEFYRFPIGIGLADAVEMLEAGGYSAIHGEFYDRIACDGSFPPIPEFSSARPSLDEAFPCVANLDLIAQCNHNKYALVRNTTVWSGHHGTDLPNEEVMFHAMQAHHFKWSEGIQDRLLRRHQAYASQNLGWAGESLKLLEFLNQPDWVKHPDIHVRRADTLGV
jgi:hypothetical protein